MELTHTGRHICYFRHALALDERRVKFLPEYVTVEEPKTPPTRKGTENLTGQPSLTPSLQRERINILHLTTRFERG